MGYYNFPHTRNYDTDLGYLIEKYQEVSNDYDNVNKKYDYLIKIYEEFKKELKDLTLEQLEEWLNDGTIDDIIKTNYSILDQDIKIYAPKSNATQDIFVLTIGEKNILCDSGRAADAVSHLEELTEKGYDKFDYVYISHYHYDHAGGLLPMYENGLNIKNAKFILPPLPIFESLPEDIRTYYNQVQNVIERCQGEIIPVDKEGYEIVINEKTKTKLEVYNYVQNQYYTDNIDYNNMSIVLVAKTNNASVCLTGDISIEAQKYLSNLLPHCDMLKVEHHSLNAWCYEEYIQRVAPLYAFTLNGFEDAGRGRLYLLNVSRTQSVLQKLGIISYASSNNGSLEFTLNRNLITNNTSIDLAKLFIGHSSLIGAINYNYQESSNNITLFDLIKGMAHSTWVMTKITSNSAVWNSFKECFSTSVTGAMLLMYKNKSAGYTGSSSTNNGIILIFPISKTSSNIPAIITSTFEVEENYETVSLTFRPVFTPNKHIIKIENGLLSIATPSNSNEIEIVNNKIKFKRTGYISMQAQLYSGKNTENTIVNQNGTLILRTATIQGPSTLIPIPNIYSGNTSDNTTYEITGETVISGTIEIDFPHTVGTPQTFDDTTTSTNIFLNEYPIY